MQSVTVSGFKSKLKRIAHRVPQSSVLGPLLFLIYVNDLSNAIAYADVNLFADDTMLFHTSWKSLTKIVNIDLKLLTQWLNANKIALNCSKTELLIFKPKPRTLDHDIKIKINSHRLHPSKVVKYLGVYIDDELNWKTHNNFVCTKLKRANGALSKLRSFCLWENSLIPLLFLFHSHMSHAALIWGQRENIHTRRILTSSPYNLFFRLSSSIFSSFPTI